MYDPEKSDINYKVGRAGIAPDLALKLYSIMSELPEERFEDNGAWKTSKKATLQGLMAEYIQPFSLDAHDLRDDRSYRGHNRTHPDRGSDILIDREQEDMLEAVEMNAVIHSLLDELKELDYQLWEVLLFRYGFWDGVPWTLAAIAEQMDVTREYIRQLEEKAIYQLGQIVIEKSLMVHLARQGGMRYERSIKSHPRSGVTLINRPTPTDERTRFTAPVLVSKLGIYQRTLNRWINQSSFPRPKRIDGTDYYLLGEVVRWAFERDLIRFK